MRLTVKIKLVGFLNKFTKLFGVDIFRSIIINMAKKFTVLLCSIILALSSFVITLSTWSEMLTMKNFWVELTIICGVVLAWLGQSPIKPKT